VFICLLLCMWGSLPASHPVGACIFKICEASALINPLYIWIRHYIGKTRAQIYDGCGYKYVPNYSIEFQSSEAETPFHYCWRVRHSFKLVWMESTSQCNSLLGYTLMWCCCSLVWPKSVLSKTGFNRLGRDQSSLRLSALARDFMYTRSKLGSKTGSRRPPPPLT
jgi:hypothetical protein